MRLVERFDDVLRVWLARAAEFARDESGQDFMEYALIGGAIAVVALGVLALFRNELSAAFNDMIRALQAARGG
jgi:Flp pilus assembly pilin Flp